MIFTIILAKIFIKITKEEESLYARLKKLWKILNENVSITIIPSSRYKMRAIRLRTIVLCIILTLIIITIGTLGYLTNYYRLSYKRTHKNFSNFKASINYEELQEENKTLKKELYVLSRETERLTDSFKKLKDYNNDIRNMIADKTETDVKDEKTNMQFTTLLSYNQSLLQQGIPAGGKEFSLYYQKPEKVIEEMQENINFIKENIPRQEIKLSELESNVKEYNARNAATPTLWPVADGGKGYISDEFGWRIHPLTHKQEYHEGLDIAVWYNTPVLATADGVVTYAGWSSGYGYLIKIRHGFGYSTYYAHLNKFKVKECKKVKRGEIIALSGNSGRSTGPHLHYEVRVNNIPKNPRKFIGR